MYKKMWQNGFRKEKHIIMLQYPKKPKSLWLTTQDVSQNILDLGPKIWDFLLPIFKNNLKSNSEIRHRHEQQKNQANINLFKVNNWSTRKRCKIYSKLTIKTPERRHWRRSGVLVVNFKYISHLFLVFLLLTLNK